ncbi:hypothetical protein B0H11DRAFT_1903480 [Mycena galericulata]|nr:hypothetical protein B0H11DRAFT_1903480 [Mycena galericulata]
MSDSPPDYDTDELTALIASLSDLDIASLQQSPPPALAPPRTPSPRPNNHVSTSPLARYAYHSPTKSGRTTDWSEAAHYSQGVAGGSVQRVVKGSEAPHPKPTAYAVFYGRTPGTYNRWSGPGGAGAQVAGVSGALYQGYPTAQEAAAAFRYALTRGWTGERPVPTGTVTRPIPSLPVPVLPPVSLHNPLHGDAGCVDGRWYIVYAGIMPGIYRSYLECALNTLSIRGAVHDSADSESEAQRRWAAAVAGDRIRSLTPAYSA